jgi:hypothetical protein
MRALSTASGGVLFVSDTIERKERKRSYHDITAEEQPAAQRKPLFTARRKEAKSLQQAA